MVFPGNKPPIPPSPGWLKVDFHLHTREDPKDCLDYSALELLQRAHALGFHALAITLHHHVLNDPAVFDAARELGIRLIPAAELRLEGADVLILNLSQEEAADLRRLRDLEAFRQRRGDSALIIAPHPFFVLGASLGERLVEHIALFDAVEICHFHTAWFDLNRSAVRVAERFQKPLIATSDAHRMEGFGRHYSWVQAPAYAEPEAIFAAVRNGCVRSVSPALSSVQFARQIYWMFGVHERRKWMARCAKRG